jgi:hypothetical protein
VDITANGTRWARERAARQILEAMMKTSEYEKTFVEQIHDQGIAEGEVKGVLGLGLVADHRVELAHQPLEASGVEAGEFVTLHCVSAFPRDAGRPVISACHDEYLRPRRLVACSLTRVIAAFTCARRVRGSVLVSQAAGWPAFSRGSAWRITQSRRAGSAATRTRSTSPG